MTTDEVRRPLFVAALALVGLMLLLELGAVVVLSGRDTAQNLEALLPAGEVRDAFDQLDNTQKATLSGRDSPPPLAIPCLALLDGIWLFQMGLMAAGRFQTKGKQGNLWGYRALLFAILLIATGVDLFITTLNQLQLMVGWLLAPPFGTLAYLATYGFFKRGQATILLSLLTILKGAAAISSISAGQQFLPNKGLVWLIFTSLFANILIASLHHSVPAFLATLADGIAALIVVILALSWAIFLLVSHATPLFKTLTAGQPGKGN